MGCQYSTINTPRPEQVKTFSPNQNPQVKSPVGGFTKQQTPRSIYSIRSIYAARFVKTVVLPCTVINSSSRRNKSSLKNFYCRASEKLRGFNRPWALNLWLRPRHSSNPESSSRPVAGRSGRPGFSRIDFMFEFSLFAFPPSNRRQTTHGDCSRSSKPESLCRNAG